MSLDEVSVQEPSWRVRLCGKCHRGAAARTEYPAVPSDREQGWRGRGFLPASGEPADHIETCEISSGRLKRDHNPSH